MDLRGVVGSRMFGHLRLSATCALAVATDSMRMNVAFVTLQGRDS